MNRIKVYRAKHPRRNGEYDWIVEQRKIGSSITRKFVYLFFEPAIKNADRLARTGRASPTYLVGFQREERGFRNA